MAATIAVGVLVWLVASKVANYADTWGHDGLSISGIAVASVMGLGALAAWIFPSAISSAWTAVKGILGISNKLVTVLGFGSALGLGGSEVAQSAAGAGAEGTASQGK